MVYLGTSGEQRRISRPPRRSECTGLVILSAAVWAVPRAAWAARRYASRQQESCSQKSKIPTRALQAKQGI
eukprot:3198709-Amphidinium_carterae.1